MAEEFGGGRLRTVRSPGFVLGLAAGDEIKLADHSEFLGLSDMDGQIRVTKTSGSGWMWGTLVTVPPDGAMSASLGTNP